MAFVINSSSTKLTVCLLSVRVAGSSFRVWSYHACVIATRTMGESGKQLFLLVFIALFHFLFWYEILFSRNINFFFSLVLLILASTMGALFKGVGSAVCSVPIEIYSGSWKTLGALMGFELRWGNRLRPQGDGPRQCPMTDVSYFLFFFNVFNSEWNGLGESVMKPYFWCQNMKQCVWNLKISKNKY